MGAKTNIQWADSTLNLQMGCQGCELWNPAKGVKICYAGNQTERMLKHGHIKGWPVAFEKPQVFPQRMDEAEKWSNLAGVERDGKSWIPKEMPRLIFLDDMGDTFASGMPDGWLESMIPRMSATPHVWMFLTKRPSKQKEFFDRVECPANIWCGASLTANQTNRVRFLCETKTDTIFLSIEPQMGDIVLPDQLLERGERAMVILGGMSGADATPYRLKWARDLIAQCRPAGVRIFVKQLGPSPVSEPCAEWCEFRKAGADCGCTKNGGKTLVMKDSHGGEWNEWPEDLRIREFPKANVFVQTALI